MTPEVIVNTIKEALRSARSIEELADALLTAGFVFRRGKEFVRGDGREPLWCEECSHFKGGPDGEGECLADCQPTWYACCVCQSYAPKSSVDCISRSELLRRIERSFEINSSSLSHKALAVFKEAVEEMPAYPSLDEERRRLLNEMPELKRAYRVTLFNYNELREENERLRVVIKILESDVATRDRLLEAKVEAAYPEFMRDYKQMREELENIYKENDDA